MSRSLEVSIPGLPQSVNDTRRRHWATVAGEARQWRRTASMLAVDAINRSPDRSLRRDPIYPADVEYLFLLTRAAGDLDNLVSSCKPILDGIVDAKVLVDDSVDAVRSLHVRWRRSSEAGVIIRIKEADE